MGFFAIQSATQTRKVWFDFDYFSAVINTWKNIAKDEKLYYFVPAVADDKKRLLTYYGEYYGDKEKPTLNSMRDVEQSSTVFYWEGV